MYKGYEIKKDETMGNGKAFFEIWKDGQMWGFASSEDDAKSIVDRTIEIFREDKTEEINANIDCGMSFDAAIQSTF